MVARSGFATVVHVELFIYRGNDGSAKNDVGKQPISDMDRGNRSNCIHSQVRHTMLSYNGYMWFW
jgi:hypothetical protein